MQIPAGGLATSWQVLTALCSGSTVVLAARLVYTAGRIVQTIEEHGRRLSVLENRHDKSD